MDTDLGELDFPAPRHDPRCLTWLSSWTQDTCSCGADDRPLTTAERIDRLHVEQNREAS